MREVIVILLVITLVGCSGATPRGQNQGFIPKADHTVDLKNATVVKNKLLDQYSEWKGTRYQLGGLGKTGVDCSGFMYVTFREKLGLELPRSTELQSKIGARISKDQLSIGDLIFFKTGFLDRHVGVYLGGSQFLHASTSKGVTVSSLIKSYWASNYWHSRRILP